MPEALFYCQKHHMNGSNVFTILYQLIVCPPEPLALESMYVSHLNAHAKITPDISVALKILEDQVRLYANVGVLGMNLQCDSTGQCPQ